MLEVSGPTQVSYSYNAPAYEAPSTANAVAVEDVVVNTPTNYGNSYPIGQCTWGVKELAPWLVTGGEMPILGQSTLVHKALRQEMYLCRSNRRVGRW